MPAKPVPGFNFRVLFAPLTQENKDLANGGLVANAFGLASAVAGSVAGVGFAEVSGLNAELEIEEYREGGRNIGPRRFPKWGRYPNLVFRRGITDSTFLWDWWGEVISRRYTLASTVFLPRLNGVILLDGQDHRAVAGWFFAGALPERLVGPGLSARSSEIAIETLELSHEGILRLPSIPPGV